MRELIKNSFSTQRPYVCPITSTVKCNCPKMNTINDKLLKRFALYDLSLKVKGTHTVLSILIQSQYILQRGDRDRDTERERPKRERNWLSVAFHSAGKGIGAGCYNFSWPFLVAFVEGWPLVQSTSAPYCPLQENHRAA